MDDLEGTEPLAEGTKPTPSEAEAATQKEDKSTVSITGTPEFRAALDKALGKGLESTNRQLSLQKAEAAKAKAEAEAHKASLQVLEAELHALQSQHDALVKQQFADDPEARQAYIDKRALAEEKRIVAKDKADAQNKLYEAEKLAWSVGMARKSIELVKETGIDPKELDECHTEDEMEVKALRFQVAKGAQETEIKAPKFDTGTSSSGGVLPAHPTVEQLEAASMEQVEKWAAARYK